MVIDDVIKLVEEDRKRYKKYQLAYSKQHELCDSMKYSDNKRKRYEKEISNLEKIKAEYEGIKEAYSRRIFNVLSQIKPNLMVRRSKEIISWDSAFPSDYEMLSIEQIRALIPLIEEDGGMYRINLI